MTKALKISLISVGLLIFIGFTGFYLLKSNTKKLSPEETIVFNQEDLKIEIYYNRPFKKGRKLFGELIPYDEVWRTGANEATTFETNKDLIIEGKTLKAGKYSLWTIPGRTSWQIIFNDKMYNWGVNFSDGKPSRIEEYDALVVEIPISKNLKTVEQFSIYFNEQLGNVNLFLAWGNVVVPVTIKEA